MSITIDKVFLERFADDVESQRLLRLLEGKDYTSEELFRKDLEQLLPNRQLIHDRIIEQIIIVDDEDTHQEDVFENGTIYPYDPSKADVDIREEPQTIYELVIRKWDRGTLVLAPNFQRNFVWKPDQQSQFIESVILNFPLPPFYINKDKKGKYIIVDGRQRITTLRRFLKDEFRLKGLKALPSLNDKKFSQIIDEHPELQTKIEDKKLLIYLIQPSVPLEMVYDIFNRINTGGTQLQRQEIRSCIYLGKATELLAELADAKCFRQAIDNGISPLRKKDQEAVLRYLSFKVQGYEGYGKSMNDFLERTMKMINQLLSEEDVKEIKRDFKRVMDRTYSFFGDANFRLPTASTRGRINLALLESISYFFSITEDTYLEKHKERIKKDYFNTLLKDIEYRDAIKISTSDPQRVRRRFEKVINTLGNY